MDHTGTEPHVDAGFPIVAGTGIVLRYHPLTLVVAPDADTERTAAAATDVVRELLSNGDFGFAAVAAALQGLVVAEQPLGVAALVDGDNPIVFLFDQAAAAGEQQRHESSGRAGWTTAYVTDDQVLLSVGRDRHDPSVQSWSRLTQGTVGGNGAQVSVGIAQPFLTDPVAHAPASSNQVTENTENAEDPAETKATENTETADEIEVLETELGVDDAAVNPVGSVNGSAEPAEEAETIADLDEVEVAPLSRDELRRRIATASTAYAASSVEESNDLETNIEESNDLETNIEESNDLETTAVVDSTVTEVLDPAELGLSFDELPVEDLPADSEAVLDITPENPEIDLAPQSSARFGDERPVPDDGQSASPRVISGPPPMPDAPPADAASPKVIAGPPPMPGAPLADAASPKVIAGPPPMPDGAPKLAGQAPKVIAGPPPMPDSVVDVTTANPATIVLTDPIAAAGPEPVEDIDLEADRAVIAGPPPMPDGPSSAHRS